MRATHYSAIAGAVALIGLLYWGANTIPPPKKPAAAAMQKPDAGGHMPGAQGTVRAASPDSVLAASRSQLSKQIADSVKTFETELATMHDNTRIVAVSRSLSRLYQQAKQLPAAAWYEAKAAKLENSEKKLTFAGQFYLQLMENESSASMQAWEAGEAVSCLEQSLKINPDNEDTKLALATGYIEGTGEPMRGVQILLAITREKPDDIPANMLLGRMSIQSGQFDKAVARFETVLKKEPDNKEALYFLAQACEGKGDKKRAIELLEKCKKIVNDPAFSKDIDQKINSLK